MEDLLMIFIMILGFGSMGWFVSKIDKINKK